MRRDGRVGLRHSPAKRVRDQNPSVGSNPTLSARLPPKHHQGVNRGASPCSSVISKLTPPWRSGSPLAWPPFLFYKDTHQTINIMQSFSGNLITSTSHCALFSLPKASANSFVFCERGNLLFFKYRDSYACKLHRLF